LGKRHWGDGVTVDDQATRAIIERARAGDGEAFASLFREYDGDVRRVCQRMLGDPQAAEDAVSEVFLRAHRALGGFSSDRPFRPWLIAIAGHYCIDQLRRRTSEARIFSRSEPQESDLESPGPSPLGRLVEAEQQQALGRAIEALPLRYRLPLLLRYFDDMNYEAIAESIGVTRNQVGTLLFRAKRLLREEVAARRTSGREK
jgi:RNA polymerase sigma-70 factor (ECF subfamily)